MWRPDVSKGDTPVYEQLVHSLEKAIRSGRVTPGEKLLPHRDLAHMLSISVGTVSRAYTEAEKRGLITSHVGRGSFIAECNPAASAIHDTGHDAGHDTGPVDMAQNLPPLAPAERCIGEAMAHLRKRADLADTLAYAPAEGLAVIRHVGAEWLRRRHHIARDDLSRLIQCNGGQHGLALAFSALLRPGDPLLCEAATYAGIRTIAGHAGYRLYGVAMDDRGIRPDALEKAIVESGARVLATIPTLQNPTTITMDKDRRTEIVAIARRHDVTIVEDDACRIYADDDCPPPFADLAPERTYLISGLSKSIAPGLRLGFLLPPDRDDAQEKLIVGIRAMGYSPPALGGLIFSQWVKDGTADQIANAIIAEITARTALARQILGPWIAPIGAAQSPHIWLPMPAIDAERLTARALRIGISLTPPDGPSVSSEAPTGIRLCLGGVRNRNRMEQALHDLRLLLQPGQQDQPHNFV